MKHYYTTVLVILFVVLDYIAIISAEQFALYIRNTVIGIENLYISFLNFWVLFPLLYIIFLSINQLYTRRRPFYKEVELLFYSAFYGILAVILDLFLSQTSACTSRLFIALFFLLSFLFLIIFRFLVKNFMQRYGVLQIPVIIIGAGKTADLLIRAIIDDAGMGYKIIGLLEDNLVQPGILERFPVLGNFDDAEKIIKDTRVKRVFIAAPGLRDESLGKLIYRIQPLVENIGVVPNFVGIPTGGVEVESIFNEKLLILRLKNNLSRPINRIVKTLFDYIVTLVGTVFVLPLLVFIAIWIYYDSPGPIIFKHIRIGKSGKPFPCYKFRSMCVDAKERLAKLLETDLEAREEWNREFKLKNDPRITRSGAFLRKTSLDELPQIFNVLRGEMSLVGPRPIIREELSRYGEFVNDYLMVKPGITGMWQVSGRNDTTYEERVQMDSWYVRNWSVWIDIMLLWRTIKAVIIGKGAY